VSSDATINGSAYSAACPGVPSINLGGAHSYGPVNFQYSTPSASSPPVISAITASAITNTSATISWTTDQPSSSQVEYGTTTGYGSLSSLNSSLTTTHTVVLTGLTPGTTYNYAVLSSSSTGANATSGNFTFQTTAPGPAISAVSASGITASSVTITWTTDQPSSSQVQYGTTTAYGSSTTLNSSLVTSHSVTISGLTAGTAYNFAVLSSNSSGIQTISGNFTFTTLTVPPVISAVASSGITTTSATITWTTDQASSSQVEYGTTPAYGSLTSLNSAPVTSHSVTISGLAPGTTYNYAVLSSNASNQQATSANFTFTTSTLPTTPPTISAVSVTNITNSGATVTWTTDQASSSQVKYGTTTAYGSTSPLDNTLVTSHSVTLTGLTTGTTYNFAVMSANSGSLTATSTNATFSTPMTAFVTGQTPGSLRSYTNSCNGFAFTVGGSNMTVTSLGRYVLSGNSGIHTVAIQTMTGTLVASASVNTATQTAGQYAWTGIAPVVLSAGTQYWIGSTETYPGDQWLDDNTTLTVGSAATIVGSAYAPACPGAPSINLAGAHAYGLVNFQYATTAPGPAISNVTSSGITANSATITWTTDQASSSQVQYGTTTAYGSTSTLNSSLVTSHSVTISGLTPGTTYNFAVLSSNSSGTQTASANFTFTTLTVAPVISAVSASGITTTSATVTWTTDQASSSQVEYGTTPAYGSLTSLNSSLVTTHSVTISGLSPGTTYNYAAMSSNAANQQATSANFTFTTSSQPTTPPTISAVRVSNITNATATVTWTTDQASSSQVKYGTTTAYGSTSPLDSTLVTSHTVTLTGLAAGTTYNFAVMSTNSGNLTGTSTNATFSTSVVAGPNVSAVVVWGITATEYGLTSALGSVSPVQTALTASHGVTLSGLTGNTTYYYRVRSTNAAGGVGYSTVATFTTLDNSGPVISNVVATPAAGNAATVSWSVSKPATSQVEYGISTTYGYWSGQTTGLQTALGWVPSGTIHFRIHSTDSAGNQTVSPDFTFIEP
jgi:hypothetical protein